MFTARYLMVFDHDIILESLAIILLHLELWRITFSSSLLVCSFVCCQTYEHDILTTNGGRWKGENGKRGTKWQGWKWWERKSREIKNLTRCWHVTISCQSDKRPPQPVRAWKSGRVHLAEGSNVVVLELPYSTEFGRDSTKFASGVRKHGKFSHCNWNIFRVRFSSGRIMSI